MSESLQQFTGLRSKARRGIWIEALALFAMAFVVYMLVTYGLDRNLRLERPFRLVLLAGFAFFVFRIVRERLLHPLRVELDDDEIALAVERKAPEMRQALISSVQFERVLLAGAPGADSPELMATVVEDVKRRLPQIPFHRALESGRTAKFAAGLALALVVICGWAVADSGSFGLWASRNLALSSAEWPRYTQISFVGVDEGLVERLPQGDSLTLQVRVEGPLPDQVFLYYEFVGGEDGYELMSGTGEREFSFTLESVLEDVELHAEGGDGLSDTLGVKVVERPRIEDMAVTLAYPEYMQRQPRLVPSTEGDVKIPMGGHLQVAAKSHKTISEAFMLFGTDLRIPLQVAADGHGFAGEFTPEETGLLQFDVIDTDRLGAGAPPKLFLRLTPDRPPVVDFKTRGVGSLITSIARIPGDIKLKDDFGLRELSASMRLAGDNAVEDPNAATEPVEIPFEPAEVAYGNQFRSSEIIYESTTMLDLKPLSPDEDQASPANKVRPGMLISLRFTARDNFGPGEPHESHSDVLTFRVVSRDKLVEELVRRQLEQRHELMRILEEEKGAHTEIAEILSPTADDSRAKLAKARLHALSRQQTAMGRRVKFIAESYQRILWEYENNRVLEPSKVRQLEELIVQPLTTMAREDFPSSARHVAEFATSGEENLRTAATAAYESIIRRIEQVLKHMEETETLAALVEGLREVIRVEDSAIKDVQERLDEAGADVFGPGKKTGKPPEKGKTPDKKK